MLRNTLFNINKEFQFIYSFIYEFQCIDSYFELFIIMVGNRYYIIYICRKAIRLPYFLTSPRVEIGNGSNYWYLGMSSDTPCNSPEIAYGLSIYVLFSIRIKVKK